MKVDTSRAQESAWGWEMCLGLAVDSSQLSRRVRGLNEMPSRHNIIFHRRYCALFGTRCTPLSDILQLIATKFN